MAVFKVTENFNVDIQNLDSAEFNINTSPTAVENISTMQTAGEFFRQHEEIKELLDLYAKLLRKEVLDLREMAEEAKALDAALTVIIK